MSTPYRHPVQVTADDIDEFKHVNNEVYLRWLLEAAVAHSDSLGYTMEKALSLGLGFVVRRHELDYLLPAFPNEELVVETWSDGFDGSRAVRQYKIIRPSDGKTILMGKTLWVYVNLRTGRPEIIPDDIVQIFSK